MDRKLSSTCIVRPRALAAAPPPEQPPPAIAQRAGLPSSRGMRWPCRPVRRAPLLSDSAAPATWLHAMFSTWGKPTEFSREDAQSFAGSMGKKKQVKLELTAKDWQRFCTEPASLGALLEQKRWAMSVA